jgi:MFS family permease
MSDPQTGREPGLATGLTLLIPITVSTMAIVLLAPILPKLQAEFASAPHADYLVPMVLTMPALCIALLSPIAGAVGDYFGRRRLLLFAFALYGIVGVAPIFLKDLTLILVSRIGVGIAEALVMTLTTTLIGDYYRGASRDRWLAAQTAVASLSALLFFNVGGILGAISWRAPFWVYTSAFAMLAATLVFTWEPKEVDEKGVAHVAHNASWAHFPWKRMLGIMAITLFGAVMFYTMQIQAASGLAAHGLSDPAQMGFLTSIASLGVPFGTFIYGRLNQHHVGRLLLAEFVLLGAGFVVMGVAKDVPIFLVGCAINQIGAGMLLPTLLVWAISQLSFEMRGRGTGLWQSSFAFGQFLSPIVVVTIMHRTGGLLPAFTWLGYAGLLAALITAAVHFTRKAPVKA